MANPTASNVAYAELAPHSVHLAVLAGRKLVAVRAFSLEAKADIAAFVAEHQLSGTVRASYLGSKNFIHRSGEAESGAVRQPAALQAHALKMPHGFAGVPSAVVVDAATGTAPDAARVTPWVLAAVDSAALVSGRDTLVALGLSPVDITLAAPAHFGAVAGSLAAGETALVLFPGDDAAHAVWVTSEGVQSVAVAPIGYTKIYEAVQHGLGLKFKAAAGKLFYNESYDFGDAGPKIAEPLAVELKAILAAKAATHLHIAGFIPSQAWLVEQIAKAAGIRAWTQSGAALAARLGLDAGGIALPASAGGLVELAGAPSVNAAWMQPTLESLLARPKTAVPFPAAKPALTVAAKPGAPVASVAAPDTRPAASQAPAENKGSKLPLFIGIGVVVAAVAAFFVLRSPAPAPTPPTPPAATPKPSASVAAVASAKPAATPSAAPSVAPTDLFASDQRKFGNSRYRFEVSDKGVIQAFAGHNDEVLIDSASGINLQGSYVGTDGRRKPFNVGGVDDVGYAATVKKSVKDGVTTFDVKVVHPRFELEQSFLCLPESIKVSAKFTPINLRDPRGVISAVHSVRLTANASTKMTATVDSFSYAVKAGALRVAFDNTAWTRDGVGGRQTIIAGDNGLAFYFTESSDPARNVLKYEITAP